MPNARKVATVDRLTRSLTANQNIALIGFDRTPHTVLESLRKRVRETQAQILVVKTSLLAKAIEQVSELSSFKDKALPLRESTAIVDMRGDWSSTLRAIHDFAKKEASLFFKMGFLDSVVYDRVGLETLAQLPSRLDLLGMVVGSLKSPVNRLDYAVKFPMTYLVNVLRARSAQTNG